MISIYFFSFTKRKTNQLITTPQTLNQCSSHKIIDGDSLVIKCPNIKHLLEIRLADIDAPEWNQKPWGEKAKQSLNVLVANQKFTVKIKTTDIYQRYIAIVYLHQRSLSINEILLAQGMATSYKNYNPPQKYLALMKKAKAQKKGIWQKKGLHQNPKKYRRLVNH